MRNLRPIVRVGAVTAAGAVILGLGAPPGAAAPDQGYVRLAHLSPDTPAVDVYLYSAGKRTPRLVLRHVGYGALSPYQRLAGGSYTVAMRPADAPASTRPVLSTDVRVRGGAAYTVAGMGPYKGIKLDVLDDTVALPAGRAGLRVIAASLKQPDLTVTAGGRTLASGLRLASATPHETLAPRPVTVTVKGAKGRAASTRVPLAAGASYTVVVLDGAKGLRLLELRDASQGGRPPSGGVDTGLGGLADRDPPSWPYAVPVAALLVLGLAVVVVRRRRA